MHNFSNVFPAYPTGHEITQRFVVESANIPSGQIPKQIFYY